MVPKKKKPRLSKYQKNALVCLLVAGGGIAFPVHGERPLKGIVGRTTMSSLRFNHGYVDYFFVSHLVMGIWYLTDEGREVAEEILNERKKVRTK